MNNNELCHSGIKGQKWGVRKYQNPDGTLTPEGKIRYGKDSGSGEKRRPTKRKIEAQRKNIMKSDSAIKVYKNANLFTTEELEQLYRRLDTKDKISRLADNEAKRKMIGKGISFMDRVDKTAKITKNLGDAAVAAKKISRLFL